MNPEELRLARAKYAAYQDENLAAGKKAAYALSSSSRVWDDENEVRAGAVRLLELAVLTASLVERFEREHPKVVYDAAKKYPWFPILLSSEGGGDTQQKLELVKNLPIGENWPFKRFKAGAQNDDLWQRIESAYNQFQGLRFDPNGLFPAPELKNKVLGLRDLNKETARKWARAFAEYFDTPFLGKPLRGTLSVNTAKETERKRSRKIERMNEEFGGTELVIDQSKKEARFLSRTKDGEGGKELDCFEAGKLEKRSKDARTTKPTEADGVNAHTDEIEKRLLSRLKK